MTFDEALDAILYLERWVGPLTLKSMNIQPWILRAFCDGEEQWELWAGWENKPPLHMRCATCGKWVPVDVASTLW